MFTDLSFQDTVSDSLRSFIFLCFWIFIQDNDEIRCASIHLMGNLSKFGSGEQVFKDQIHNVLVSLLLHLVDPNPHVVKVTSLNFYSHERSIQKRDKLPTAVLQLCLQACKYAMRVCAPVVGSEQITTMFQTHLHDDKSLHYGEFINDLTKYLVRHNFTTEPRWLHI